MNKWIRLGITAFIWSSSLYLLYALDKDILLRALASIGMLVWWMGCLIISWWIENWYEMRVYDND